MNPTCMGSRALSLLGGAMCLILPLTPVSGPESALAQQTERCAALGLAAPAKPLHFHAKVQGMAPPEEVRRQTAIAERRTGGVISPDYANFPRIIAIYVEDGVAHSTIAAVVDGHIPQPGDAVELASRYLDPRSSCNFIPWTVVPASSV
jgi:hypothetical protein